jgi:hypothetical protein
MTNKASPNGQLYVTSHVARDLLQNAALFRTDKLVVWEYVSNGLEYVDKGTNPIVKVTLDSGKKRIIIADNGRGMDWRGLQNFFVMHGENIDRKHGKPGRGRFGTGKSAAFGIADILRVSTVKNGKRSRVELRRSDIQKMDSEDPIPVRVLERESPVSSPNGTVVEIEGMHLRSLDQMGVIHYIERHLAKWRNATVFVNNQECEFSEPPIADEKVFYPEGKEKDKIGNVKLTIKIASAPLDEELRGISIYSNGIWHETTLAGNEGREMSQYIFGEIDIPRLDEDKSPIPPFDLSRSMRLNPSNELVQRIYAFIGQRVDQVRRELVKEEKQRKAGEDAKRLSKEAEAIARVINEDFDDYKERVARARAKGGVGFDLGSPIQGGLDHSVLDSGSEVEATIIAPTGGLGSGGGGRSGGEEPRRLNPQVSQDPHATKKEGKPAGGKDGRQSMRGGFRVEFKSMGTEESRALYVREDRTIYINTDHPQLIAAKGMDSVESTFFQRLAYEIAFSEYAIALAAELNANGEYIDPSDPIVSIRETINRIARKAAHLYSC